MGTSKLKDIIDKVDFIAITQALNIKTYPNGTGHTFKTKCPAKCSPDDNQGLIDNKTGRIILLNITCIFIESENYIYYVTVR